MNINEMNEEAKVKYLNRCGCCTVFVGDSKDVCMMPVPCFYHDKAAWEARYREQDLKFRRHFINCVTG